MFTKPNVIKSVKVLFFLALFILLGIHCASAHILKIDGTVGGVLHIDPNDEPIAGAPSHLVLDLKDTSGKFSIENCNCTISVVSEGKQIFSGKIGSTTSNTLYTFPSAGIYSVIAEGSVKSGAQGGTAFQSFKLSYDIRVEEGNGAPQELSTLQKILGQHALHIIIFGGAIIIGIILTIRDNGNASKV